MKHKITLENASVLSINNGEITVRLENGFSKYFNASLLTVNDGRVEILVSRPLTMEDLETGMLVQYTTGEHRLVIKITDSSIRMVDLKGDGWGRVTTEAQGLLYCIERVWEPRIDGSIDRWFKISPDRKVIFER